MILNTLRLGVDGPDILCMTLIEPFHDMYTIHTYFNTSQMT